MNVDLNDQHIRKARAKAMRLLEHMDRTEKGLEEKLRQADFSDEAVSDAISYVKSFGYINDRHYAEVYIRGRIHTRSQKQIFQELMKKGIDREMIRDAWEAVAELEEPDEREMIRSEILKKYSPGEELDEKSMRRLQGYFARRGFRFEDVTSELAKLDIRLNNNYTDKIQKMR